jgi:hypothetical protein
MFSITVYLGEDPRQPCRTTEAIFEFRADIFLVSLYILSSKTLNSLNLDFKLFRFSLGLDIHNLSL